MNGQGGRDRGGFFSLANGLAIGIAAFSLSACDAGSDFGAANGSLKLNGALATIQAPLGKGAGVGFERSDWSGRWRNHRHRDREGHGPYSLSVEALQDVHQNTDITLFVDVEKDDVPPAEEAHKVILRSSHWKKILHDLELTPNEAGDSSSATVSYTGLGAGQTLTARMWLKRRGWRGFGTVELKDQTTIALRPDLAVQSISAPASAEPGQPVNLTAHLRELNGGLGAITDAYLTHGGETLDAAIDVEVTGGGTADVMFVTAFDEPGTYELVIGLQATEPGDYDPSNDSATVTIVVESLTEPATYSMEYQRLHYNSYNNGYVDATGTYVYDYSQSGDHESFYMQVIGQGWRDPIAPSADYNMTVDGVIAESGSDGGSFGSTLASYSGTTTCYDAGTGTHVDTPYDQYHAYANTGTGMSMELYGYRDDCSPGYAYAYLNRSAADYVYTSVNYGPGYSYPTSGHIMSGSFLDAQASLSLDLVMELDGVQMGGTGAITDWQSVHQPVTGGYNYWSGNYNYYGSWDYWVTYGYGSGTTVP